MPYQSWILIIVTAINLGFVAALSFRSQRTLANRLFIASIFFNVLWSAGDAFFIGLDNDEAARISSQLFFIAPVITAYCLLLFSRTFLDKKPLHVSHVLALTIPPIVLALVIGADGHFLINDINLTTQVNTFEVNKLPFIIYTLYFSIYFGLSYLVLFLKAKSKKGLHKKQVYSILFAAISSSFLAVISNLSLPLFGQTQYIWLGPIFTFFYVMIVSYAIAKHRLFDLRATVARFIAYLLSIGGVVALYMFIVFVLSGTNLITSELNNAQRLAFITLAVVSAIAFSPLKAFFDKITNSLFYRDAYDTQQLLDDLNKTLVNSVELEELLTKCSLILQENIKTAYCTFYIRATSYFPSRIIGAHRNEPELKHVDKLEEITPKIRKKIHDSEQRTENENELQLNAVLKENDFEVIARLVSTLDYEVKGLGYFFLGPKKSGSPYTKQDLKTLEIIANELVIGIENVLRFEEIQEFNVTLQKKIDDATKELKQTNQKLLALDEAKDEFVSMASHQLRTPLTSIKGYLSMVLEGDAGKISVTQKEMLGQAFFSSQRMVYLIADLLNVSRLKTGKFTIETKPVYLPDVVASELDQLQEGSKAKNLKLSFTKPDKFPTLNLDEMKIRQVVMNFTDNAIYYTPQNGTINVELKETPKSVEFRVIDSGIGVPKDEKHKLFTKFYRAENARKTRPDGTGLGLFMAKKVIVAQGGSIIFDSKEGKGSTFGFSFPKAKLLVEEKTPAQDDEDK